MLLAGAMARPSVNDDSVELPPLSAVLPLFIADQPADDDDTVEADEAYVDVDTSDEHYVKKRAIIAPVQVVSEVKHENVAVDDDSFEAAESSHIFRPRFRQRSVPGGRLHRRATTGDDIKLSRRRNDHILIRNEAQAQAI